MNVGLVLGGGGIKGGAWLTGALDAIAQETGWDPGSADVVVGTSAGSVIGTLLVAGGIPPWFMVAHSAGERFDGLVDERGVWAESADRSAREIFRLHPGLPRLGPGSWSLGLAALRHPRRFTGPQAFTGWLPRGVLSTVSIQNVIRRAVEDERGAHPNLWLVACDYRTGERVAFGRDDAPLASLPKAVAASCAVPALYRPVRIRGRDYVDGGVRSPSNLDLLAGRGLDLVIALNPTSSLEMVQATTMGERVAATLRAGSGRRLGREAGIVRRSGTEVVLLQPTGEDVLKMGANLMNPRGRHDVVELARTTTARQLAAPEVRALLRDLPPGDSWALRRPDGDPSTWPRFAERARERLGAAAAAA